MLDDQRGRHHGQAADTTNAITLTLTIIVIMYAVLVSPAEISNIFTQMINSYLEQERSADAEGANNSAAAVQSGDDDDDDDAHDASVHPDSYNVAVAVGNTLQTLNFACNFILYCAVNVHFRRIVREMVTCRPWWRWTVARPNTNAAVTTAFVERKPAAAAARTCTHRTDASTQLRLSAAPASRGRDHFDINDDEELSIE